MKKHSFMQLCWNRYDVGEISSDSYAVSQISTRSFKCQISGNSSNWLARARMSAPQNDDELAKLVDINAINKDPNTVSSSESDHETQGQPVDGICLVVLRLHIQNDHLVVRSFICLCSDFRSHRWGIGIEWGTCTPKDSGISKNATENGNTANNQAAAGQSKKGMSFLISKRELSSKFNHFYTFLFFIIFQVIQIKLSIFSGFFERSKKSKLQFGQRNFASKLTRFRPSCLCFYFLFLRRTGKGYAWPEYWHVDLGSWRRVANWCVSINQNWDFRFANGRISFFFECWGFHQNYGYSWVPI